MEQLTSIEQGYVVWRGVYLFTCSYIIPTWEWAPQLRLYLHNDICDINNLR